MSATKRIDGDYSIISTNKTPGDSDPGFAKILFDTNLVDITGDLRVAGNATFIDKENVTISDNIIELNKGEIGTGVTLDFAGIQIDRGLAINADLLWDEILDQWTVDLGTGVRKNILVAFPAQGPALHNIVEDITPQLGGTLDVNGQVIGAVTNGDVILAVGGSGVILLQGPVILNANAPPGAIGAGDIALFTGDDTGGGTQIHFINDTQTDELVSKTKAITYSLIF